jgi:hypothetical protein
VTKLANIIVWSGKVYPLPIDDIICNSTSEPSGRMVFGDLTLLSHASGSLGIISFSKEVEMESLADDRSIVPNLLSTEPIRAIAEFRKG